MEIESPPKKTVRRSPKEWAEAVGANRPLPALVNKADESIEDTPPKGRESPDQMLHETAADMQANRSLREKYAGNAYELACGCISMWAVFLAAQGIVKAVTGVDMWSEKVIIAVTAGVTVNVLAAFLGVIRGLFPQSTKPTK